jgi:hypothetical protein
MRLVRLIGLLAIAVACLPTNNAVAAPLSVTSTANGGPGTLRAAIDAANSQAGPDSIQIEVGGTILIENRLPQIEDDLAITGPGPESLTVRRDSTAAFFRVFEFNAGVTGSLTGMTVTGGSSSAGGGILNGSGSLTLTRVAVVGNEAVEEEEDAVITADGGGIHSAGPLTLHESVISGNQATASGGSTETAAGGAGIFTFGKLTIDRSTISGNVAKAVGSSGGGEIYGLGGGVYAVGEVKIERSTISGNSVIVEGAGGTQATGGGLSAISGELTSVTVTGNSASAPETLGANLAGDLTVRNSLISNPAGVGESCFGTLTSEGYNLDEDGSCDFGKGSDLANVDPLLGPLAANGGPTPTHALTTGSVAIDRGNSFGATVDQRGFTRPVDFAELSNKEGGDGSDIGAFELQAPPAAPVGGAIVARTVAGDRTPPNTRIVFAPARVTFERQAKFRFVSTEPQSHFQCKVDKSRWRGCRNPFKRKVSAGGGKGKRHLFKVRAIDRFGNVDSTPSRFGWRVKSLS